MQLIPESNFFFLLLADTTIMKTHGHDSLRTLLRWLSESSAVQIGTAFILVSHVEATQAAARARRDRRGIFLRHWARVWKVLNETVPTSP